MNASLNSKLFISALLAQDAPLKWVFTGDSITHGSYHTMGYRDYTEHFSERLRSELGRMRDCVIKMGVSGWRITHVADDLEWNVLQYKPNVVSLKFGMNDCTEGPAGLPRFIDAYHEVIERIQAATGAAIILHTPNLVLRVEDTAIARWRTLRSRRSIVGMRPVQLAVFSSLKFEEAFLLNSIFAS